MNRKKPTDHLRVDGLLHFPMLSDCTLGASDPCNNTISHLEHYVYDDKENFPERKEIPHHYRQGTVLPLHLFHCTWNKL